MLIEHFKHVIALNEQIRIISRVFALKPTFVTNRFLLEGEIKIHYYFLY